MSKPRIDLDSEAVELDGQWLTKEDLARRIRSMLDAGDFSISRPSQALEELTRIVAEIRTLAFRAGPELAEAVTQAANERQVSPGAIIRQALDQFLGVETGTEASAPLRPSPVLSVPAPVPLSGAVSMPAVEARPEPREPRGVPAPPPNTPVHGSPVAVKGVPVPERPVTPPHRSPPTPSVVVDTSALVPDAPAPTPVNLTPQKTQEEEAIERRWFGG